MRRHLERGEPPLECGVHAPLWSAQPDQSGMPSQQLSTRTMHHIPCLTADTVSVFSQWFARFGAAAAFRASSLRRATVYPAQPTAPWCQSTVAKMCFSESSHTLASGPCH